ncbi:MAG: hypothetical protein EOP48_28345 [Sphingobacteriales bacterium]|nr:MAG: hypothetical protein EOP48_28345 [Sphingobacteriales bacterium]
MSDNPDIRDTQIKALVPEDFEALIQHIKDELKCPLPIKENEEYFSLRYKLVGLWRKIARELSVDREWFYIYEEVDEQDLELHEELFTELYPIAINIHYWINQARAQFLQATKPIQCVVADTKVYAKHLLRRPLSTKEIIKLCRSKKASFLFTEMTGQVIREILLYATEKHFEGILDVRNLRLSVVCNRNVGVTDKGEITNCLMIDIDGDNSLAHAYPCSFFEATNNVKEYKIRESDRFDHFYLSDDDSEDEVLKSVKFTTTYVFPE